MRIVIGPYRNYNKKTKKTPARKIQVRIDKYDTWSMDHTLSLIIVPMLKQLIKTKHGAPYTDDEDAPTKLRASNAPKKKNEWDTDKNHFKRWDWILKEMLWAFEQQHADWESRFHTGKHHMLWQGLDSEGKKVGKPVESSHKYKNTDKKKIKSYQMIKGPKDTSKFDRDGAKKYYDRIKNGYRLFGKYYDSLWD